MVRPAPRSLSNEAARELVLAWFGGRADLQSAIVVVAERLGSWWFRHALENRTVNGRRGGLGCMNAEDVRVHLVAAGWQVLGGLSGSQDERDEIMPVDVRVRLLRAVAALEAVDTDEIVGGAS